MMVSLAMNGFKPTLRKPEVVNKFVCKTFSMLVKVSQN